MNRVTSPQPQQILEGYVEQLRTDKGKAADTTAATIGHEAELWKMADSLCDPLLSKQVSGELRVRDAERFGRRAV